MTKVCPVCRDEFTTDRNIRVHCSRSCSNKSRRGILYTGEQPRSRYQLRLRLIEHLTETRGYQCENCGNEGKWNGLPLTLQVDHINGDNKNDSDDNIRLLCPNCHTQTPTFCRGMKGLSLEG